MITTTGHDTALGDVEVASQWLGIEYAERAADVGIELMKRAIAAIDRGDAARAHRCLDHVERLLPEDLTLLPVQARATLAEVRASVSQARARAAALSPR